MKKILLIVQLLFIMSVFPTHNKTVFASNEANNYEITMKRDILCLMMAYPNQITAIDFTADGFVYIITNNNSRILYDDKKIKSSQEKLNNPDLQDMLEAIYPLNTSTGLMPESFDPGRCRVYPLLNSVYGCSEKEINSNLTSVTIGSKHYSFNSKNNASSSLIKVMEELLPLCKNNHKIYSNIFPPSGTFNYRYIKDTNKLSPHAYGIAIDLARNNKDYWKWATRIEGENRILSYPTEIVQVFEKNNFIWGGKWGHFDILHFEYRPEMIIKSKYFKNPPSEEDPWYNGLTNIDNNINDYIELIDSTLN